MLPAGKQEPITCMAALAEDTDDDYEREHFIRLRDAWITLANRCEPFDLPDVTEK